jgi:hypothetical protein
VSRIAHAILGLPAGVPLSRLGTPGAIAQILLMLLPFVLAPMLAGWIHRRRDSKAPSKPEIWRRTGAVAISTILLCCLFWVGAGAWFGLLQGTPRMILLTLAGPPIVVVVLFRLLFPLTLRARSDSA